MKYRVQSCAMALLGLSGGLLLCTAVARADSIDGSWCHSKGGRFSIAGPVIVTPAGTRTQGTYARHYFSYAVPPGDPGAGTVIDMRLLNEEAVEIQEGPQAKPVVWQRCAASVS